MGKYSFWQAPVIPWLLLGLIIVVFSKASEAVSTDSTVRTVNETNDGLTLQNSQKLREVIKDEIQNLNKQFTEALVDEKFRQKRAYTRFRYDVKLDESGNYLETNVFSGEAYSFVCNEKVFVLQLDGIYRLGGFNPTNNYVPNDGTTPTLAKVQEWSLNTGDRVLHAHEWEQKCFVSILNKNGTFTSIYTLHGEQMTPVFRQQIRNYGFAKSAKFFTFNRNLYLIIINDNAVHSLTICPLFRWAGTYMDEIHAIQTRGAAALETFIINSKQYIAIAQGQDASGNYEVGTQILRMDSREELEKVQLLWSYSPVALQYIQILQEHYLVIGLEKESSICYFFGGIDFIYSQTLEGFKGKRLFMDTWTLPDWEPVLIAVNSHAVQFFTRSNLASTIVRAPFKSNASALAVKPPTEITHAKLIRPSTSQMYLALTQNKTGYLSLKIYPLLVLKQEIAESHIKESESQLSQCLIDVRRKLNDEGQRVKNLEDEKQKIVTVDGDLSYNGNIVTSAPVTVHQDKTKINDADINPEENSNQETYETSPAEMLKLIKKQDYNLNENVMSQLGHVLMKSKSGNISGDYTFLDTVEVKNLKAYGTNLVFETLNSVPWYDIDEYALRKESYSPQSITGYWAGNHLTAKSVQIKSDLSGVDINDFLLKKCPNKENFVTQEIYGNVMFNYDVKFDHGLIISPEAVVNNIPFSDVVLKHGPTTDIRGYKHVLNLVGGEEFEFSYINERNYQEWFNSVMHTDGPDQYPKGLKTLASTKGNVFENLHSSIINNRSWKDFYETALVNGANQTIEGELKIEHLVVDSLVAKTVAGVQFEDLMTVHGDQKVNSYLNLDSLTIQKDLNTELINGIELSNLAVKNYEDAVIEGPVELEDFQINGSIHVPEYVTIAGKDVSELGLLRQKHIYYLAKPGDKIYFSRAQVEAENLEATYINDYYWSDLEKNFWSKSSNNVVPGPLDLSRRKVNVQNEFTTGTLNSLDLEYDVLRVDESVSITSGMNFVGDVYVHEEVYQSDEKTLNDIDFSEYAENIVKVNEEKLITGRKHFVANVVASGGADIANVNGIHPVNEVVFLESEDVQYVTGVKKFKNKVNMKSLLSAEDIYVNGTVNGYNLSKIHKTTAYSGEPVFITGDIQFNNSFYASGLYIAKEINRVNVTSLLKNAIYLNQPQKFNFPIIIENGTVEVWEDSFVSSVNGIVLKDYLPKVVYTTSPKDRINGTKTFVHLTAKQHLDCSHFNGISLSDLSYNALSRTQPQEITGKMYFESINVDSNLEATEIAGVLLSDLVHANDPESCKAFTNVRFTAPKTIVNGPLRVKGLLNGYPADQISTGVQRGLGNQKFKEIRVKGALNWEYDRGYADSISHIYQNAVTLDTPQVITGNVQFAKGFEAEVLESYPWINDIDLQEIINSAVREGDDEAIFYGKNKFRNKLEVSDPPLNIDRLDVGKVNGVDIRGLNSMAVRDSYTGTIYGKKTFTERVTVDELTFKDLMNKGDFSWLVTTSDNRTVHYAEFYDVYIEYNLNFNYSEGINLNELLKDRVTLHGDEIIYGNYTIPSLNVSGHCNAVSINGIPTADIYYDIPGQPQKIYGDKQFSNGVVVDGKMDLPYVNGYNFAALHSDVYRRTENEKINRPVVFVHPVVVNQSVQVKHHINGYDIDVLSNRFDQALKLVEQRAFQHPAQQKYNLSKIEEFKSKNTNRPFWLEYLRLKQDWGYFGPKSRVEHTATEDGVIIGLYEQTDGTEAALPKGCHCNTVQFFKISNASAKPKSDDFLGCTNAFIVTSPLGNLYTVLDKTVSYNQTCTKQESAVLAISKGKAFGTTTSDSEVIFTESSKGYLADVKTFSENGTDYLIVAYFYDYKSGNHGSGAFVYAVQNTRLTLVQTLPTSGVKRLAITYNNYQWQLAVANTRNLHTDSCISNSAIYRWSSLQQKFLLLRDVKTDGVVDVTFLTAKDKSANYEGAALSFVALAQNGNSGDGEVVIYLYDEQKKNYFMLESMRIEWSVTALDFFCIQENCYLLVVVPQEGIRFYEYRYVEGFQLSLTVPVVGAQDIGPLSLDYRLFFAIASAKKSILAESVIAGHPYLNDHEQQFDSKYNYNPSSLPEKYQS